MDKLKLRTPDFTQENIARLAELFPNCVTEVKDEGGKLKDEKGSSFSPHPSSLRYAIDFDQLRQELSDHVVDGPRERYRLDWPGKREALLAANAPIAKTLRPCREESVDFDTTKNLFIEGDNLDALKLLQETYLNKVKLIYIDPPYNTGNDFVYDDDFSEDSAKYFQRSNQTTDEGVRLVANTEANGRFHSDWLTMMFSRLKLARNLLTDDGVLFVSIDDNEVASLRRMCDEIFGESRFVSKIVIQSNKRGQTYKEISKTHEYLLAYSKGEEISLNELEKDPESLPYQDTFGGFDLWELRNRNPKFGRFNRPNLFFPIYVNPTSVDECDYARISLSPEDASIEVLPLNSQGAEGCWRWGKEKILSSDLKSASPVLIGKQRRDGHWNIYEKSRKSTTKAKSIWSDVEVISEQGTVELGSLGLSDVFDHPKPLGLLKRCIHLATSDDDIILDFFSGSATTAHAAMLLNSQDGGRRRFVMVQLPEPCADESGANQAGYKTIAGVGKERIRRAGKKVKEEAGLQGQDLDIGFRVLKVDTSNMKDVYYKPDALKKDDLFEQIENIKEDRTPEDLLFQVLLDWGVDLTLPISKEIVRVEKDEGGRMKDEKGSAFNPHPSSFQDFTVFFVDQNALAACFDAGITEELVKKLAARKPLRVVFRDAGFSSDSVKINVEQIFKLLSPDTEVKAI